MMDLPPPQQPTTMEIQKMDQKQNLIQKIRKICEDTLQGFKEYGSIGLCNLRGRAYFVDVCNASNADEIFSYRASHWLLDGCRDGLESRPMSDYGVNPEFSKYHITSEEIFGLKDLIIQNPSGKGTERVRIMPDGYKDCSSYAFKVIYTILRDNPDFNPEFTTFTFGGTMADMPPLRDKDGNPNMDFFRAWKQKTEDYYYRK